jgi:protein-tyrosine-phosphatase
MAEALFLHRVATVGEPVHVHSAGLITEGEAATPFGVEVMAGRGLDLSGHISRRLSAELINEADLILGMGRRHVAEVCVLVPEAFGKAFTLKELVRRGEEVGPRKPGQTLADWLADVHWGRTRRDLLGRSSDDDIADPVGKPKPVYERTAVELEGLLDRLVHLVWSRAGEPVPQREPAARGWWDD